MRYFNPYKQFTGIFIPEWLLKIEDCSMNAKSLYGLLAKYAGKNGHCFPGQDKMAEAMGCSERSISRYLNELIEHNLIDKKRIGLSKTNRYFFIYNEELISSVVKPKLADSDRTDLSDQHQTELSDQEATRLSDQNLTELSDPYNKVLRESASKESKSKENKIKRNTTTVPPSHLNQVIEWWNNLFSVVVDINNESLVNAIRDAIQEFGVANLIEAMKNRNEADYYKQRDQSLKNNPKCFFNYKETIKNDLSRQRFLVVSYPVLSELMSLQIQVDHEIMKNKLDKDGKPMWKLFNLNPKLRSMILKVQRNLQG